jgi:hypothetical protein
VTAFRFRSAPRSRERPTLRTRTFHLQSQPLASKPR